MKFVIAIVLGIAKASASIRMQVEQIRNEQGGLSDVLRNPHFKLDSDNQSYLFMDISTFYGTEKAEKRQLKKKVDLQQKSLKKQNAQKITELNSKFGAKAHRLGSKSGLDADLKHRYLFPNELYYLSLEVGGQILKQRLNFLLDTGSDWLAIQGTQKDCPNCPFNGARFIRDLSDSFKWTQKIDIYRNYGSFMHLEGNGAQDQVCLGSDFSTCVESFEFLLITDQVGLNQNIEGVSEDKKIAGILGMAPGYKSSSDLLPKDFEVGPLLLDYLVKANKIKEKSFSLSFTKNSSFIEFGVNPLEDYGSKFAAIYIEIKMEKGFFYTAEPQGVRFGGAQSTKKFALASIPAIFTTGLSISMVPKSLSADFFKKLLVGIDFIEDNGVFYVNCEDREMMQDVSFMFDEHWIQNSVIISKLVRIKQQNSFNQLQRGLRLSKEKIQRLFFFRYDTQLDFFTLSPLTGMYFRNKVNLNGLQ